MSADTRDRTPTRPARPVSQQGQHVRETPATRRLIGGLVSVTIDGKEIKVPLGTTILEAAKQLGVRIPTLCYHQDLCIAGVCRICVVEVEGQRTLQASCAYPITAPLKVHTHTPKVRQARRHIIDLLLSKHYGECYAAGATTTASCRRWPRSTASTSSASATHTSRGTRWTSPATR